MCPQIAHTRLTLSQSSALCHLVCLPLKHKASTSCKEVSATPRELATNEAKKYQGSLGRQAFW